MSLSIDFASLFLTCSCGRAACRRCSGFQLTPRTAAVLHTVGHAGADHGYDDVLEHGDDPVGTEGEWSLFADYPRITYSQNAVWRRQAARAFDDLASDIELGRVPAPRCPAEEMALRLMLTSAEALVRDVGEYVDALAKDLPTHPDDFDWPLASECLLEDDDIAELFRPASDGIEDPDGDRNRALGIGDYRPSAWFDWFGGAEPRDGRRPFRRRRPRRRECTPPLCDGARHRPVAHHLPARACVR